MKQADLSSFLQGKLSDDKNKRIANTTMAHLQMPDSEESVSATSDSEMADADTAARAVKCPSSSTAAPQSHSDPPMLNEAEQQMVSADASGTRTRSAAKLGRAGPHQRNPLSLERRDLSSHIEQTCPRVLRPKHLSEGQKGLVLPIKWEGLDVRQVRKTNVGSLAADEEGVFATELLKAGTVIPVVLLEPHQQASSSTHKYQYAYWGDGGDVSSRTFDGINNTDNMEISMKVNEPPIGSAANLTMDHPGMFIVTEDINADSQLFVHYGDEYTRITGKGKKYVAGKRAEKTIQQIAFTEEGTEENDCLIVDVANVIASILRDYASSRTSYKKKLKTHPAIRFAARSGGFQTAGERVKPSAAAKRKAAQMMASVDAEGQTAGVRSTVMSEAKASTGRFQTPSSRLAEYPTRPYETSEGALLESTLLPPNLCRSVRFSSELNQVLSIQRKPSREVDTSSIIRDPAQPQHLFPCRFTRFQREFANSQCQPSV